MKARITEAMKDAMRQQHNKDRLTTIRLILAAIKQKEIDERKSLTDEEILIILNKMIKQRRESITQYEKGNRPDLVAKEAAEIVIIQEYLPEQLTAAQIEVEISAAVANVQATAPKDIGKVMAILSQKLQGKADFSQVSALVKARLSQNG